MATQQELRDQVTTALKALEDGSLAQGRASGRTQALASMPKLTDVNTATEALLDLVTALKGVGATQEAAQADHGAAILAQVAKALTSATVVVAATPAPAPAPALTGLAALGKATPTPSVTGATRTAGATVPASVPTPSHSATRVEPVTGLHTTDAENDKRLAEFHKLRSNYMREDGVTPRVPSGKRVEYFDDVLEALVMGITPPTYVLPDGAPAWANADAVRERLIKLFA